MSPALTTWNVPVDLGCLQASKQTVMPVPLHLQRPSQRTSMTTCLPSSARWIRPILPTLHWYLPWFAVDAALQGRGLGNQLMKPCLQIVDASHLPAYLETPNPRTIPFYQRHGFEVTGEAQAGTCPPITFMLRASR